MIIDFHTHIFHPAVLDTRDDFLDDPGFAMLYTDKKSRTAGLTLLSEYMDANSINITVAMSFPWQKQSRCAVHNEYMASVMQQEHNRVFCFGMVPFLCGRGETVRAVRDIKNLGLAGIGELAFYTSGFSEESSLFLRHVLEAAAEEALPVCIHVNEPVGHTYAGKYDPQLGRLYTVLKAFRELRVVLSHWGGGLFMYELMPEVKENLFNVYYDTAATPYLYSPGIMDAAIAAVGPDKIIFGSDFPLLGISRYAEILAIKDNNALKRIMYENSIAVLGI